jgi:hypothetical protein
VKAEAKSAAEAGTPGAEKSGAEKPKADAANAKVDKAGGSAPEPAARRDAKRGEVEVARQDGGEAREERAARGAGKWAGAVNRAPGPGALRARTAVFHQRIAICASAGHGAVVRFIPT